MILLTRAHVTRYRYPIMSSIHREENKPNWFCHYYDPEGFRRKRSTGTENAKIARTICVNVERAAALTRQGKLSNEKALKLVRETCDAIAETHGKLAANRAEAVLKPAVEEFIRIAGGEFTSYTVRGWLDSWIAGRTDASKATVIEYRRIIEMFLKFLGARADRALTMLQPRQIEDFKASQTSRVAPSSVNKCVKVLKAALNAAVKNRQLEFNPAQHVEFIEAESEGESRRPFTSEELAALLTHASADWRTMILRRVLHRPAVARLREPDVAQCRVAHEHAECPDGKNQTASGVAIGRTAGAALVQRWPGTIPTPRFARRCTAKMLRGFHRSFTRSW